MSGARIGLDLSQFFTCVRKKSYFYIDYEKQPLVSDVENCIRNAFELTGPIVLVNSGWHIPSNADIRVIRDGDELSVVEDEPLQRKIVGGNVKSETNTDILSNVSESGSTSPKRKKKKKEKKSETDEEELVVSSLEIENRSKVIPTLVQSVGRPHDAVTPDVTVVNEPPKRKRRKVIEAPGNNNITIELQNVNDSTTTTKDCRPDLQEFMHRLKRQVDQELYDKEVGQTVQVTNSVHQSVDCDLNVLDDTQEASAPKRKRIRRRKKKRGDGDDEPEPIASNADSSKQNSSRYILHKQSLGVGHLLKSDLLKSERRHIYFNEETAEQSFKPSPSYKAKKTISTQENTGETVPAKEEDTENPQKCNDDISPVKVNGKEEAMKEPTSCIDSVDTRSKTAAKLERKVEPLLNPAYVKLERLLSLSDQKKPVVFARKPIDRSFIKKEKIEEHVMKKEGTILEKMPSVGTNITFKILKMKNYCPGFSEDIVAKVCSTDPDSQMLELRVSKGLDEFEEETGKFSLDTDDPDLNINKEKSESVTLNWSQLLEPKII